METLFETSIKSNMREFKRSLRNCNDAYDALQDKSTSCAASIEKLASFYTELIAVCERLLSSKQP